MARPGQPRVTPESRCRRHPIPPARRHAAVHGCGPRSAEGVVVARAIRCPWRPRRASSGSRCTCRITCSSRCSRGHAAYGRRSPARPARGRRGSRAGRKGGLRLRCARRPRAGVVPGMALNSALALQPGLRGACRASRGASGRCSRRWPRWRSSSRRASASSRPTACCSRCAAACALFGGARRLCELLRAAPAGARARRRASRSRRRRSPRCGSRARAGGGCCAGRMRWPARLAPLPLAVTRWPERTLQSLATMGVRTVGECLRLPRDGFARRFEPRLRARARSCTRPCARSARGLRRARSASPRDATSSRRLADTARLQRACEPLLDELCAFLQGRGAGIESLELRLLHRDAPATRLRLRFAEPVATAARIARLLHERLARVGLARAGAHRAAAQRPAGRGARRRRAICSRSTAAAPRPCRSWSSACAPASATQAVHGLCLVPEHRPEAAQKNGRPARACAGLGARAGEGRGSRSVSPFVAAPGVAAGRAAAARGRRAAALRGGTRDRGRTRSASSRAGGTASDVRRDYYVARTPAGARLWIFRERRAAGRLVPARRVRLSRRPGRARMGYAELHCLSNFSFLRGASHPEELVERAAELGYAALAITDECSVAGVVRAHGAARERGLKLIVGSELRLDDGLRCVLLATDRRGYGQLCRLITRGRRAAPKGQYRLLRADFAARGMTAGTVEPSADRSALHYRYRLLPASGLLASGCPPPDPIPPRPRWLAERLSRPTVDRGRAAHHRAGSAPARGAAAARARTRPAARGGGRRAHARAQPARAAGRAHRHAPRRAGGAGGLRAVPERRAPPAAAAAAARSCIRPSCSPRRSRSPRAARSRSTSCATSTRARSCPRARRRRAGCGGSRRRASGGAGRRARPPRRARSSSTSSR